MNFEKCFDFVSGEFVGRMTKALHFVKY